MTYFVPINSTITLYVTTVNGSKMPSLPDAAATYRIYGPSSTTVVQSGSYSATEIDHTNAPYFYAATSVGITAGNGFAAGNTYVVRNNWLLSSVSFSETDAITVY